ncbi:dynactin subunit 5-like [Paramacrobiotus metropolitanus]|uniref:dynactin subunit 5-like n=1 Tax=Paramacrobiotus metropolitanus TaxID=2943436 RepID=UPI002445BC59|nr:dynactin subunit 5-like [Paramacrobiotus metropolitanus]
MLEPPERLYNPRDYVETNTGNKVSKKTILCGSQQILLSGKSILEHDSVIRADLSTVKIGRYFVLSHGAILKPSYKPLARVQSTPQSAAAVPISFMYSSLNIGDFVYIGEKSVVQAASIGSHVYIGHNCVVSRGCVLRDCISIADNTFVAPDTIIPPFTIFAGNIGKEVGELPDCTADLMEEFMTTNYAKFVSGTRS